MVPAISSMAVVVDSTILWSIFTGRNRGDIRISLNCKSTSEHPAGTLHTWPKSTKYETHTTIHPDRSPLTICRQPPRGAFHVPEAVAVRVHPVGALRPQPRHHETLRPLEPLLVRHAELLVMRTPLITGTACPPRLKARSRSHGRERARQRVCAAARSRSRAMAAGASSAP